MGNIRNAEANAAAHTRHNIIGDRKGFVSTLPKAGFGTNESGGLEVMAAVAV